MELTLLPREILDEIVGHLDKRDIRKMATVSKAWRKSVSFILDESIAIKVGYFRFLQLIQDLDRFPGFASKITQITVTTEDLGSANLRVILNKCQNLLVLRFTEINIYEYVNMLNSRETKLPKIQNIHIIHLLECSPAIKRFDVWVNYRFKNTITSLQFMDIAQNGALKNYGGFMQYLSKFPKLTSLKINGDDDFGQSEELDLNEMLEKQPNLESICIKGKQLKADLDMLSATGDVTYPSLKTLHLDEVTADIKLLSYIKTRFTQVEDLALVSSLITPNQAVGEQAAKDIIKDFNESTVKDHKYSYHYKGQCYNNGTGRSRWAINLNLIHLDMLFREHLWDHDHFSDHDDDDLEDDDEDDFGASEFFDHGNGLLDEEFMMDEEFNIRQLLHEELMRGELEQEFYPEDDAFSDHGHEHEEYYDEDDDYEDYEEEEEFLGNHGAAIVAHNLMAQEFLREYYDNLRENAEFDDFEEDYDEVD